MLNLYRPGLTRGLLLGPLILAVICFVPKGDFLFTLLAKYLTFRFIVEPDIPALSAAPPFHLRRYARRAPAKEPPCTDSTGQATLKQR